MPVYITVKQSPMYHQMSLEEFLFSDEVCAHPYNANETNTRTYKRDFISDRIKRGLGVDPPKLLFRLVDFNRQTENLRAVPREELYSTFYAEKNDGGFHEFFSGMFRLQKHYIRCDSSAVYAATESALDPLIHQHPTKKHEEIYDRASAKVQRIAQENGMTLTSDDFDSLLSSSWRRIDAPCDALKESLRILKTIFEDDFHILYHTSAFAYIKKRSTLKAMERHRDNKSRWFAKFDLHNFFGSTTMDFIMKQFAMVYPFSELLKLPAGRDELTKALELAILNGSLPQGTPISPLITNIMMIPIDFTLANRLRELKEMDGQRFVYTRYADDFQITSRFDFDYNVISGIVIDTLAEFGAPFTLNTEKTRYGSSAGRNWNLGLMLNKDNNITVGYEKKRKLKSMLASYVMDSKRGDAWEKNEIQVMEGIRNYCRHIEGETIDAIVDGINRKFGVDVVAMIKEDLRTL